MAAEPFSPDRYVVPSGRGDAWANRSVAWLTRHGISLFGSRVLSVPGRRSGRIQQVPVNLLTDGDRRWLVAVRGNTQWVRNARAAGRVQLRVGRRAEDVVLREVPVDERVPALRAYLKRWGWEVGKFLPGLTKNATDDELRAAAPGVPVFEVLAA